MDLKANKNLVVVLSGSLVFSLFFAVLAMMNYASIQKSNDQIEKQKKTVQGLLNMEIKPTQDNLNKIKNESASVQQDIVRMERVFGHPSQKYLEIFCNSLPINPDSFRKEWFEQRKANKTPLLPNDMMGEITKTVEAVKENMSPQVQQAMRLTLDAMKKAHVTNVEIDDLMRELMLSLDVPLSQNENDCISRLTRFKVNLKSYLQNDTANMMQLPQEFNFGIDESTVKNPGGILLVEEQMRTITYLMMSMHNAKISELEILKHTNADAAPTTDEDGFKTYTYEISFKSDIAGLRHFVNDLANGVKYYHFFVLKDVRFTTVTDEVESLLRPNDLTMTARPSASSKKDTPEKRYIIGNNPVLSIQLIVDYVMYVGKNNAEAQK